MLEGFAIPHAKAGAIKEANILVIRLAKPIDWNSLDGIATEFIIALFIPDAEVGSTHLKLLSKIARLLMKDEFRDFLKAQDSKASIVQFLNEKLSEDQTQVAVRVEMEVMMKIVSKEKLVHLKNIADASGVIGALAIDLDDEY